MKKISAVLLIAVLASGFVFAGVSGWVQTGVGYNLDTTDYGFIKQDNKLQFNLDLATATGEKKGEGDIYAEINGSVTLLVTTGEKEIDSDDPFDFGIGTATLKLGLDASNSYARVVGPDWSVAIDGVASRPDYAKSAIDTYTVKEKKDDFGITKDDYTETVTYKLANKKAPGITATYKDFKVGFGMKGKADELDLSAYVATPDFEIADGVKLQAAAVYTDVLDGTRYHLIGASGKLSVETDNFSVKAAGDFGYDLDAADFKSGVNGDASLAIAVAPVAVDVYYARNVLTGYVGDTYGTANEKYTTNLLSAKIVTDLNEFDVPVKLTLTGKDLINTQNLKLAASVSATEELTVGVYGGYVIDTKKWSAGADAEYAADMYTLAANVDLSKVPADAKITLGVGASISSSKVIPGASLSLGWYDAEDILNGADPTGKDNLGYIRATCKIAF